MIKSMKGLRIAGVVIAALFLLSSIAFGINEITNNTKEEKEAKEVTEAKTKDIRIALKENIVDNNLISIMRSQGLEEDEIAKAMDAYTRIIMLFSPARSDVIYITDMVKEGYDLLKIVSIYDFLTDTNYDIVMVRKIYDIGKLVNFSGKYWIEDAFNAATNKKHGELTVAEINQYTDKGISYDDIKVASIISRKGVMTVKEIMEKKAAGVEWIDIFTTIYGSENIDKEKFKDEKNGANILNCVKAAKITQKSVNEIYDRTKGNVIEEVAAHMSLKRDKVKSFMEENKLDIRNNKQAMDRIKQKISEKGLKDQEISQYISDGYTSKEILKATDISKKVNMPVSKVLSKYRSDNIWIGESREVKK